MSLDYLEDLERQIINGKEQFACPGSNTNEWYFAGTIEELAPKAQRTADGCRFQTHIYRLLDRKNTTTGDSFLVVRKILQQNSQGAPNFQWSIVDTLDAAEMMRDVSQGPTPLFGATIEQTFNPK